MCRLLTGSIDLTGSYRILELSQELIRAVDKKHFLSSFLIAYHLVGNRTITEWSKFL